ncbi:DUF2934 domain-containing protein [Pseudomonas sp. MM211]|uniref:DUF2934 domain-containing protein n=1 Tax=Pseudomonas sp. MM211 TaxID=2866808 RepID=UPI001CED68C1|nr:DUF2934 domain-containing protein [Pseudomonas sp. MM211]UCJ15974.1 DUF2934 domain-containing protein [Pseudomonas sp. MM211]
MSAKEERIREFAYQIWESEGKPSGQAKRHWEMATKLADAEQTPAKATTKRVSKPKAATTEPKPAAPIKPRASKTAPAAAEKPAVLKPAKAPAKAKPTTAKPTPKKPKA